MYCPNRSLNGKFIDSRYTTHNSLFDILLYFYNVTTIFTSI